MVPGPSASWRLSCRADCPRAGSCSRASCPARASGAPAPAGGPRAAKSAPWCSTSRPTASPPRSPTWPRRRRRPPRRGRPRAHQAARGGLAGHPGRGAAALGGRGHEPRGEYVLVVGGAPAPPRPAEPTSMPPCGRPATAAHRARCRHRRRRRTSASAAAAADLAAQSPRSALLTLYWAEWRALPTWREQRRCGGRSAADASLLEPDPAAVADPASRHLEPPASRLGPPLPSPDGPCGRMTNIDLDLAEVTRTLPPPDQQPPRLARSSTSTRGHAPSGSRRPFAFAVAAWRNDLRAVRALLKDAAGAIAFRHRGANDDQVDRVRTRILGAVTGVRQADLVALNADLIPKLLSPGAARGAAADRDAPPGRPQHVHRVGLARRSWSSRWPPPRHDRRHRHRVGRRRRRRLHRRAGRPVRATGRAR